MNTRTRKPGFAHRAGRAIRRGWDKLNQFELGVARRAGRAYPSFGFRATRIFFLIMKLAVLAVLAFVAAYIVLCILIFWALIALANRPQQVEVTNWDEQNEEERLADAYYFYDEKYATRYRYDDPDY